MFKKIKLHEVYNIGTLYYYVGLISFVLDVNSSSFIGISLVPD